jgi:hypothetical protein
MKKLIYLFSILLVVAGCKKSAYESAFGDRPETRTANAISEVNTKLTTATDGWVGTLSTQEGGGYGFYMNFDATTQVVNMYADMTDATATVLGKSTFRVKANAGAELIFDTYNYISLPADPDPSSFGGETGAGFRSDVEFIYDHSTADSILFTGKKYRQPLVMVKATAAQKALFAGGGYKTAIDKMKTFFQTIKNPYIDITAGSAALKAGITMNASNDRSTGKRFSFTGLAADGKTVGSGDSKFAFSLEGADLLNAGLVYEGVSFKKIRWKDATTLAFYDAAGKEYVVKSSPSPLLPLYILMGAGYKSITTPNATTYPGWGSDFIARRATAATGVSRWSLSTGSLRLSELNFTFNDVTKKMVLVANTPAGTSSFSLTFNYTYTKSESGVFKFTIGTLGGNEAAIAPDMASLLAQRINVDNFTLDYFTHPVTGATLGQFKSIEHPDFTFTGALQ